MTLRKEKTDYELNKCGDHIMVWKNSKCVAKGFFTEDSALHAVWVLEGKVGVDFYTADENGVVTCCDRLE